MHGAYMRLAEGDFKVGASGRALEAAADFRNSPLSITGFRQGTGGAVGLG
jgi:hypothetical protein